MKSPDPVLFDRVPVRVDASIRRTADFRAYRAAVKRAGTFEQMLSLLEHVLAMGSTLTRAGVALDFSVTAPFARRFVNSIGARRTEPKTRALAARAARVVMAIQTGTTPRTKRSMPVVNLTGVLSARAQWHLRLAPLWNTVPRPGREVFLREIETHRGTPLPQAYRQTVARLLSRHPARLVDVVNQVTAFETGASVHAVRRAVASRKVFSLSA